MKTFIKFILQRLLGFRNYLFIFSLYIIHTLRHNRKEGDFLHFLSMLPAHSTVLDIGANIGVMTVHLARKLPASRVFSFEPVPDNLRTLRRLIRFYKLKNVTVFDCALGNYQGTAEILLPEHNNVKFQGLSHIKGIEGTEGDSGVKYTVPMHRLDDIEELQSVERPVAGIKIDVENYEFFVLDGARQLLLAHKPLIYAELWDNKNRHDCMNLLQGMGYSTFVLLNGELVTFEPHKHQTQNFFFSALPQQKAT